MAVNRFYSPQRAQYISQFVPEQLPLDLMLQGISAKQKQYDTNEANLNALGDWKARSLEGYDTDYVKGKQSEIRSFIDQSQGQDLASPEYIRKYTDFVRKFKGDEGLKAVANAVAIDDEYQKRIKELKESKDGFAYANALEHEYKTRRAEYTKKGGLGYTGQIGLGDPSILTGVDKVEEMKKLFDDIKDSGAETIKELEQGIYYKNGNQGVSTSTINTQALNMLNTVTKSRLGDQLKAEYAMEQFGNQIPSQAYAKLDNAQKEAYLKGEADYIRKTLINAGNEFVHNKFTTNKDDAKNKLADWGREDAKLYPQQPVIDALLAPQTVDMPNYQQAFGDGITDKGVYNRTKDDINKTTAEASTYTKLINYATKGGIPRDKLGNPILSPQEKLMIEGIPGADKFIKGIKPTSTEKDIFVKRLQEKVDQSNYQIHTNELYLKQMDDKIQSVASTMLGDKKYDNMSFKVTMENGREAQKALAGNPIYEQYLKDVASIKNEMRSNPYLKTKSFDYEKARLNEITSNLTKEYEKATGDRKEQLGETLENMKALSNFHKATSDFNNIMSNKDNQDKLAELYNSTQEYQPAATLKPLNKTYMAYEKDKNGKVTKSGPTQVVDYKIEELMKNNPQSFIFRDDATGKIITPTILDENNNVIPNPDYPTGGALTIYASAKELLNDRFSSELKGPKAMFGVKGKVKKLALDPTDPTGERLREEIVDKSYTVVANELVTKQYTEAKAKEAYSNLAVDQGFNPNNPNDLSKLSEAGKSSYKDYIMYKDPERFKNLSQVNALRDPGQKKYFSKRMYNPDSGKDENLNVKVTKSESGDGTFILEVSDNQGNKVVPKQRYNSSIELDQGLEDINKYFNAEKENNNQLISNKF